MTNARQNDPMVTGTYGAVGSMREAVQGSHRAWYMSSVAAIIVAIIFSVLDASTLFTQFDTAMNSGLAILWLVTSGICIAENFVPMLAAAYFHQCYTLRLRGRKYKILFGVAVGVSVLLLGALMYMRWATRNASIDTSVSGLGGAAASYAPEQTNSGVRDSLATVLSIVPWITSAITFMIAYFTDNPLEKRRHALQLKMLETKERLTDLNATLKEVEEHDLGTLEDLVKAEYLAALAALEETASGWEALARRKMMEKIGTPQAISQLSGKAETTSVDLLPSPMNSFLAAELRTLPDSKLDTAG